MSQGTGDFTRTLALTIKENGTATANLAELKQVLGKEFSTLMGNVSMFQFAMKGEAKAGSTKFIKYRNDIAKIKARAFGTAIASDTVRLDSVQVFKKNNMYTSVSFMGREISQLTASSVESRVRNEIDKKITRWLEDTAIWLIYNSNKGAANANVVQIDPASATLNADILSAIDKQITSLEKYKDSYIHYLNKNELVLFVSPEVSLAIRDTLSFDIGSTTGADTFANGFIYKGTYKGIKVIENTYLERQTMGAILTLATPERSVFAMPYDFIGAVYDRKPGTADEMVLTIEWDMGIKGDIFTGVSKFIQLSAANVAPVAPTDLTPVAFNLDELPNGENVVLEAQSNKDKKAK